MSVFQTVCKSDSVELSTCCLQGKEEKKKNDAERIHEIKVQVLAGIGNEFLKRHREWKIPLIKVKILFSAYFFKSQVGKPSR